MRPKLAKQPQDTHPYRRELRMGKETFLAPVIYGDRIYAGKRFDPIERCRAVSMENREIVFEYVCLDQEASSDMVLSEIDRNDVRPALYEEACGFIKKYPDEQRKVGPIIVLGSEVIGRRDHRSVACLWCDEEGMHFSLIRVKAGYFWRSYSRFLVVREESLP